MQCRAITILKRISPLTLSRPASTFVRAAISVALVFVPPAGTGNVVNYEVNLMGQAAIVLGVGGALYWFSRRKA